MNSEKNIEAGKFMLILLLIPIMLVAFGCISRPSYNDGEVENVSASPVVNNTGNAAEKTVFDYVRECNSNQCYASVALMFDDISICNKISVGIAGRSGGRNEIDNCIAQVAYRYNNSGYCNMIADGFTRENCEKNFQLTNSYFNESRQGNLTLTDEMARCDSLSSSYDCYAALAISYEVPSLCGKTLHEDDCIMAIAVKYNKPGYCDLLSFNSNCRAAFK